MLFFIFDILSLTPFATNNFAAVKAHDLEVRQQSQFWKKLLETI